MAQKNRTKELWLIPKRVNLHQTVCLIDGMIERNYDGTSWKPQKQNDLGVNLKRWGATKDGKNISSQAIRTLVASIPQYLGFLYVNTEHKPNTICLTEAGRALWDRHRDELVKVPNLKAGKERLLKESDIVLKQMEKLQITNPIINKDCENIGLFPFRFMIKLLLQVGYLDQEEIAYFLFQVRNEDELDQTVEEIESFRRLPDDKRESRINAFRDTHIGSITLVKASSAGYFMSLCQITGIIDRIKITPDNRKTPITALKIRDEYLDYAREMIDSRYKQAEVYDFKDNLQLWIDYMGNPSRDFPPVDVSIVNKTNGKFLVQVYQEGCCKYDDLINEYGILQFPMFVNEQYDIKLLDIVTGGEWKTICVQPSFEQRFFEIEGDLAEYKPEEESLERIADEITAHCEAANFSEKTLNYLNTLYKTTGIDKTNDKSLRGAYLEYYVYRMLGMLREEAVIDDVIWNGRIGKYGLPTQAPGGKTGTSDIIFIIDDFHFVLELTTIKSKSLQFRAEGSSVPDHVRLYRQNSDDPVVGVFCAPIIHERNTAIMQSAIASHGIPLHCICVSELVALLLTRDREEIKTML